MKLCYNIFNDLGHKGVTMIDGKINNWDYYAVTLGNLYLRNWYKKDLVKNLGSISSTMEYILSIGNKKFRLIKKQLVLD